MTATTPETISRAYRRDDGLWVFPRKEFVTERFNWHPGQHVLFAGPTQNGKTSLAFDLLDQVSSPEVPAIVIVSKPRDPVSQKRGAQLGFRRVSSWPPKTLPKELMNGKPRGYLLWPKFGDMYADVPNASRITEECLDYTYADGARGKKATVVLDDTYVKSKVLGLDRQMTMYHAMAGAMGISAWTFVQKATGAGETALMAYGAADHVFLFYEPDENYRKRYGEIGGVNPKLVESAVMSLKKYQCVYICRNGKHMCIVDRD